jgi:queuine tRNA-ribosyltransferase
MTTTPSPFTLLAQDGEARAGYVTTAHGEVETPVFMPVGTQASVKAVSSEDLERLGPQIILGNTYHLALRPGAERIRSLGGLHAFMSWKGSILTDSGGYQVFSLADSRTIDDDGVTFRSHIDGSAQRLTPESAMGIQAALGSDIAMAFDECPPSDASDEEVERAMARTTRWAERCLETPRSNGQLRFGIVQGGVNEERRRRHLEAIASLPFDGLALGGFSVGEPPPLMHAMVKVLAPAMPAQKARYLMGVGTPIDLLAGIEAGIDMFDCVMPTRNARNGQLFLRAGRINIANARHREDPSPVEEGCPCECCSRYSRAYLSHLFHAKELLFYRLATVHNLSHYLRLVRGARAAILEGRFGAYAAEQRAAMDVAQAARIG